MNTLFGNFIINSWLEINRASRRRVKFWVKSRPTRNYIHRSNRKRFSNFLLTKARKRTPFLAPSLHVYQWNFEGSLWRLCFLMRKFSKNERRACDHRVWLLEWPQAPLVDLTAKSGATANLKFSDFQVESTGFLGLRARPTLRSNRPGELAVTWEARLGDRKLVFRFSKIYALKNTAD